MVWLLGVAFACNNSIYFGTNAFLPDYLAAQGRSDLISAALGVVSGAQLVASFILLLVGERLHRRAWPFLVFGSITCATLVALMAASGAAVVVLAAVLGFATAVSFVILLALPAVLSPSQDVHRTAAGMFTISYAIGVIVPDPGWCGLGSDGCAVDGLHAVGGVRCRPDPRRTASGAVAGG